MALQIHGEQKISDLGRRVLWLAQNTPYNREYSSSGTLDSLSEIEAAIVSIMKQGGERRPSDRTFENFWKGSSATWPSVLDALSVLFPCVALDWLICDALEEFEERGARFKAEMDRWKKAAKEVAQNRGPLQRLAKDYHRAYDATPDFPLITQAGWLLHEPFELTEPKEHPPLKEHAPDFSYPKLFDGHGDYWWVKRSQSPKAKWFNGPTFRLLQIRPGSGTLSFDFCPGHYADYVSTCEFRAAELADAYLRGRPISADELPLRGEPQEIFDFAKRSAFPGVNCLVFLKGYEDEKVQPRGNYFVMHLRGERTGEAQNTNHVVPAGGHQPGSTGFGYPVDQDVWRTAVREFVEELFDKEEAAELKRGGDILAAREVQAAVDVIFRQGRAKVFLLGVGIDPLTTKPEVLIAIVVDWAGVVRDGGLRQYVKDSRGKPLSLKIKENYEGVVRFPPLSAERLATEERFPYDNKPVLPAGAACLRLAAQHYGRLFESV